jgi:hypothetical protein
MNLPALIDGAQRALDEARTIDDVKAIRGQAAALQRLTRGIEGARDAYNRCGEIKIYAERRMGDELSKAELKSGRPRKNPSPKEGFLPPKLADIGITEKQSHRYQQLASIPERELRAHLEEVKRDGGEVTTAGTLRLARQAQKHEPKSATYHTHGVLVPIAAFEQLAHHAATYDEEVST